MLKRNIPKFLPFVIISALFFSACGMVSSTGINSSNKEANEAPATSSYGEPTVVGTISSSEITESSGIAASLCNPGVLWTHNDSGGKNHIFAINSKGEKLGTWAVTGAKNSDWEDIAAFKDTSGECFLYIGDIGNNERFRGELSIYRVKEPKVTDSAKDSSKKSPLPTENALMIKAEYPEIRHDSETIMIHPKTGDIYILTKRLIGASGVYKLSKENMSNQVNRLEKIADLSVPAVPNGFLTGGDISPDGKRIVICDYFAGYELVLPENAKNFDDIWKAEPQRIELGQREQGEAITYSADGKSIFVTSEKKNSPVIEVKRK